LADNPISITIPICAYKLNVRNGNTMIGTSAPKAAMLTDMITEIGMVQLSYCATRNR
jgi:hypothetical protein